MLIVQLDLLSSYPDEVKSAVAKLLLNEGQGQNNSFIKRNLPYVVDNLVIGLSHDVLIRPSQYSQTKHYEVLQSEGFGFATDGTMNVFAIIGQLVISDNLANNRPDNKNQRIVKISQSPDEYMVSGSHLHMKPLINFGDQSGQYYIVMKFVPGQSLANVVYGGSNTVDDKIRLCINLAEAYHYQVASEGITHKDMQSKNIICSDNKRLFFIDYGNSFLTDNLDLMIMQLDEDNGANDLVQLGANFYEIWNGNSDQVWELVFSDKYDTNGVDLSLDENQVAELPEQNREKLANLVLNLCVDPSNQQQPSIRETVQILEEIRLERDMKTSANPELLKQAHQLALVIKLNLLELKKENMFEQFVVLFNEHITSLSDDPQALDYFLTTLNFSCFLDMQSKDDLINTVEKMNQDYQSNQKKLAQYTEDLQLQMDSNPNNLELQSLQQRLNAIQTTFIKSDKSIEGMSDNNAKYAKQLSKFKNAYDRVFFKPAGDEINSNLSTHSSQNTSTEGSPQEKTAKRAAEDDLKLSSQSSKKMRGPLS